MSRPLSEWDEDYILSLPKENNEFDRKGSKLLDLTLDGVKEGHVLDELAKQLSAFANMRGGKIIYGLTNDGTVDNGGVSTQIKAGGTKEWLERQVAVLSDYEILGVGVREFVPASPNSQIQLGKALYVIDVPDSDRAPHQSRRDYKYYVRLNSQSQPAPHRMIEDIRNRQKHPSVSLDSVKPKLHGPLRSVDPQGHYAIDAMLTLSVANNGTLKSADTFLLLNPEQGQLTAYYGEEIAATMVRGTKAGHYMWHLNRPLPPQSEISFLAEYHFQGRLTFHPQVGKLWSIFDGERPLDDLAIEWTVFADSAPPRTNRITMFEIGIISMLNQAMTQHNTA